MDTQLYFVREVLLYIVYFFVRRICLNMDSEKLIGLVHENRCLWDMKDKNYHNRDIARQKWDKVAMELNTSIEAVKTKWRGLRDTFRKELGKNCSKRSGDEGGCIKEPKWAYFKCMEFLKDQFQKRQLQGNVPNETTFDEGIQKSTPLLSPNPTENEPESQTQTLETPQNAKNESSPPQIFAAPPTKIAKMNNTTAVKKLLMIEEQKLQMFKEKSSASRNEDPDYHFMMSLVPYLNKVPEERKMFVRNKLQQVFCEESRFGRFGGQLKFQPIQKSYNGIPTCSSSTSDSWKNGLEGETPLITPQHEDLASLFSSEPIQL